MDTAKQPDPAPAVVFEKSELQRKRCKNCGKPFMQSVPWQEFCRTKCRMDFHHNKGAFGPMKAKFPKWIADEVKKQLAAALAQLPVAVTAAELNDKFLEFDFVTRQELTPEGVAIVRAAGKKKRAAAKSVGTPSNFRFLKNLNNAGAQSSHTSSEKSPTVTCSQSST